MPVKRVREFLQLESSAGLFLIAATFLALIAANTAWNAHYHAMLETHLSIAIGQVALSKPLLVWINDGLMVIFFFLVGLELKREFVEGHLSQASQVALPAVGALGGIITPAAIFYYFNREHPEYLSGWAIPAATDIAFALGILSLCSRRVPSWAKMFLLTLAIFDDLAAIGIIAVFYTHGLSINALLFGLIGLVVFLIFNRNKVETIMPYIVVGIYLWICVLKSGVHATLAGVTTAMFIPVTKRSHKLEAELHPWVAFGILPLFAFANTGINIRQLSELGFINPISLGVALGLFVGKQVGVFSFCFAAIHCLKLKLPTGFAFSILYGLSVLSGIGFTMSLFITSLAYTDIELILRARSGVLIGTLCASSVGFAILHYCFRNFSPDKNSKAT